MSILKERVKFTYEDYLCLPDNGKRYQVIEGDVYMVPAPTPSHQDMLGKYESRGVYGIGQSLESPTLKGLKVDLCIPSIGPEHHRISTIPVTPMPAPLSTRNSGEACMPAWRSHRQYGSACFAVRQGPVAGNERRRARPRAPAANQFGSGGRLLLLYMVHGKLDSNP